jgi:AraC-like DNA-binding protein
MRFRTNASTVEALASVGARRVDEAARMAGVTVDTLYKRIRKGLRGADLLRRSADANGRSLYEIAKLTGYVGCYAKRLCARAGVDAQFAPREAIARVITEHERGVRERRVKRAKAARKAPRRSAGPTVKQLARSVGKSKGAIYRRALRQGVTFHDVIQELTEHPSRRRIQRGSYSHGPRFLLDGVMLSRTALALALGVSVATVDQWNHGADGIARLIEKCRAGQRSDAAAKRGRPAARITVGGVSEPLTYWCNRLGMGREGLWSAAKKRGLTTAQEIARRVALESQEVAA